MVIYVHYYVRKHFSKSKSHSLKAEHDQTISLDQKNVVPTASYSISLLGRSTILTNSTSGTKNVRKTNTPLRVLKNHEHRDIATLSLQLRSHNKKQILLDHSNR